uniref:Transmembrane protein n=1 Tax=Chromera velia CCMP2878 TaxID=1169474 RepID=A0A0G4H7Y2_9ALVE|eukprot:Cvel_25081.t1-p1 / transcript=Cvel_25081.t1 / gene=Cvel_25081 / organism=Chromera_velia_CCMP2878 / gene_product=Nuclear control of ATPase protein 2, putative / transcript_product=Nuclear control of ATPase protein 2, putative / location=Cvel_scaffold2794:4280-12986(+) / protein_length=1419 / sequence_SO=supercontig / SO=protein_coding / is_pseudo=false
MFSFLLFPRSEFAHLDQQYRTRVRLCDLPRLWRHSLPLPMAGGGVGWSTLLFVVRLPFTLLPLSLLPFGLGGAGGSGSGSRALPPLPRVEDLLDCLHDVPVSSEKATTILAYDTLITYVCLVQSLRLGEEIEKAINFWRRAKEHPYRVWIERTPLYWLKQLFLPKGHALLSQQPKIPAALQPLAALEDLDAARYANLVLLFRLTLKWNVGNAEPLDLSLPFAPSSSSSLRASLGVKREGATWGKTSWKRRERRRRTDRDGVTHPVPFLGGGNKGVGRQLLSPSAGASLSLLEVQHHRRVAGVALEMKGATLTDGRAASDHFEAVREILQRHRPPGFGRKWFQWVLVGSVVLVGVVWVRRSKVDFLKLLSEGARSFRRFSEEHVTGPLRRLWVLFRYSEASSGSAGAMEVDEHTVAQSEESLRTMVTQCIEDLGLQKQSQQQSGLGGTYARSTSKECEWSFPSHTSQARSSGSKERDVSVLPFARLIESAASTAMKTAERVAQRTSETFESAFPSLSLSSSFSSLSSSLGELVERAPTEGSEKGASGGLQGGNAQAQAPTPEIHAEGQLGGPSDGGGGKRMTPGEDVRVLMEVLDREYEKTIRSPLRGTFTGPLPRLLLIQVQQQRTNMQQAMLAMDRILRSNEATFEIMATLPAVTLAWVLLQRLFSEQRGWEEKLFAEVRTLFRRCERLMDRYNEASRGMSEAHEGFLVFAYCHCLRVFSSHPAVVFVPDRIAEFAEDMHDVMGWGPVYRGQLGWEMGMAGEGFRSDPPEPSGLGSAAGVETPSRPFLEGGAVRARGDVGAQEVGVSAGRVEEGTEGGAAAGGPTGKLGVERQRERGSAAGDRGGRTRLGGKRLTEFAISPFVHPHAASWVEAAAEEGVNSDPHDFTQPHSHEEREHKAAPPFFTEKEQQKEREEGDLSPKIEISPSHLPATTPDSLSLPLRPKTKTEAQRGDDGGKGQAGGTQKNSKEDWTEIESEEEHEFSEENEHGVFFGTHAKHLETQRRLMRSFSLLLPSRTADEQQQGHTLHPVLPSPEVIREDDVQVHTPTHQLNHPSASVSGPSHAAFRQPPLLERGTPSSVAPDAFVGIAPDGLPHAHPHPQAPLSASNTKTKKTGVPPAHRHKKHSATGPTVTALQPEALTATFRGRLFDAAERQPPHAERSRMAASPTGKGTKGKDGVRWRGRDQERRESAPLKEHPFSSSSPHHGGKGETGESAGVAALMSRFVRLASASLAFGRGGERSVSDHGGVLRERADRNRDGDRERQGEGEGEDAIASAAASIRRVEGRGQDLKENGRAESGQMEDASGPSGGQRHKNGQDSQWKVEGREGEGKKGLPEAVEEHSKWQDRGKIGERRDNTAEIQGRDDFDRGGARPGGEHREIRFRLDMGARLRALKRMSFNYDFLSSQGNASNFFRLSR